MRRPSVPALAITASVIAIAVAVVSAVVAVVASNRPPEAALPPATAVSLPATTPVGAALDPAFLAMAQLPAGQERVGTDAARAWCADVRATDRDVTYHGRAFEHFPDLRGYDGVALETAAVTFFCPEFTDQIPAIGR